MFTLFTSSKPTRGEILRLLLTRPRTAIAIARFGASGLAPANGAGSRRIFHHLNARLAELLPRAQRALMLLPRAQRALILLPRAQRALIPRAPHNVHEDNPAAWTSAVSEFLLRR